MSDLLHLRVAFGKALRQRRKELGLTQADVARLCGIGISGLSRIETGQVAPDVDRADSLAVAVGLGLEELMRRAQGFRRISPAATSGP